MLRCHPNPMKTNYLGHESQYQKRRAQGFAGWETNQGVQENLATFAAALSAPYVPRQGRLLEMGCGAGDIALWLAEQGYEVHGVDIAPSAIAWAKEKAKQRGLSARFLVGDVRELKGFTDDSFDLVIDGRCLHCIIGEDRAKFLSSAWRVLRPGGFLHINTMCNEPVSAALRRGFDPASRCQSLGDVAVRYCGLAKSIVAEVVAGGFDVLSWRVVSAPMGEGEDLLHKVKLFAPVDLVVRPQGFHEG